ncbi:hypothetical protein IFR04_002974 [Cadophora malorum]|uniref:Uncharacterized protein n=1 Tax=Cadophora malorum TaxID=108018 RepID=A0A8H7WFG2_9HELO|nr:hypothetical protein IFR04_002974 [Cadophora malorum]
MHGSVHIPDPVPRNSNAPKHVRMDEWKEYPLKQEEDVERWRNFMGGGREIATGYELRHAIADEPSHPEHPRYHNLPHQQFSAPDRSLAYHDTDMDFNVAAGLMGLSQSQGQNHPQGQNTNHGHAQVPTQLSTIPNPGFSSPPLPHSQKTTYPVLASNYAADYNTSQDLQVHQEMSDPNQNPDPGQSPHSNLMHGEPGSSCGGGWQGSPPPPSDAASQDTTGTQRQTELVRSQQLSAAYRNIYY